MNIDFGPDGPPNNTKKGSAHLYTMHDDKNTTKIEKIDPALSLLLKQIPDKPEKLYAQGNISLLSDPKNIFLCIIGSRKHTQYGHEACRYLIEALKGTRVVIVSGLALGIDGLSHLLALEAGLPCIAVPGSGLNEDVIYPRAHLELSKQILRAGGLLISELDPDTKASPWSFPMRNRIMAGLSHAVLIIEGEQDSGTLITARLALEYNRNVLALPGSIFSETSKGPLSLIKNGAMPICGSEDLLVALGIQEGSLFNDKPDSSSYSQLSDAERLIINILKEPIDKSELQLKSKLEISKFIVIISMLEIKDLIKEECGLFHLTKRGRSLSDLQQ